MNKLALVVFAVISLPIATLAEVVRVDVEQRTDVASGVEFGLAGPYEKIAGRVYFAADPTLGPNEIITDIRLAPHNGAGRAEWSAEFFLIKPKEVSRGNGTVLLEVGNRGGKGLLSFFNGGERSSDPEATAHFGDGFLQRNGFTLLWVGWQWDTPEVEGRMRMFPPVATQEGKPIRGLVRADFVPREPESDHSLADRNHIAYPVADRQAAENVLTVRDTVEGERRVIPRSKWRFARVEDGQVVPDSGRVYLDDGFEPHRIYEVVYVSENPSLVGLGPAAIRDMVSHLKYESSDELSIPKGAIDRALAFGISQSGRFLRTFLFYGFNEDESHRKVFDGVIAHVAGGGRGSFNHRFAQASRDAHPFLNFFHPTDIFPFTDLRQADFETGVEGGILSHQKPEHHPKVFYTNSSYEYWGRAASLIHTSIDAREDAPIAETTRVYSFAGTQHGAARFPAQQTLGQQASNPMAYHWSMRALLLAMDRWADDGPTPPPSQYGSIEDQTMVAPEDMQFPKIPGVTTSTRIHKAYRADYGPQFRSDGVITQEPPEISNAYPMRVPAVDADGNEVVGIQMPEHTVPLATYTGWNLFNEKSGPIDVLSSMQGSYIPFPRTKKERNETNDPRLSIEERYGSRERYLGFVAEAAVSMVEDGYLLAEDVPAILTQASTHWDYLMTDVEASN